MKVRTLIAGAAVVFLCGGFGVCVAQEAPPAASAAAPASEPAGKPCAIWQASPRHHQGKHHAQHGQQEFTEQELQAQTPSK